jgi:hypothetical protein
MNLKEKKTKREHKSTVRELNPENIFTHLKRRSVSVSSEDESFSSGRRYSVENLYPYASRDRSSTASSSESESNSTIDKVRFNF